MPVHTNPVIRSVLVSLLVVVGSGHAQCLIRDEAVLVPPDPTAQSQFGAAVDLLGDRAAVGGPSQGLGGAVDVFAYTGDTWMFEARLEPTRPAEDAAFGAAVAWADDLLLVGAPYDTDRTIGGSAFVFRRDETTGVWSEEAMLLPSVIDANANFGAAVAWVGDRAIVGAFAADTAAGANSGAVHVFACDDGTWVEEIILVPADAGAHDFFGYSLDAHGDRFLAGSLLADTSATDSGSGTVYRLDGDAWVEEMTLAPEGGVANTRFGRDVAIDANAAVMLSWTASALQIHARDGIDWPWVQTLGADNFSSQPESVAMSGSWLVTGFPSADGGHARVFVRDGDADAWTDLGSLRRATPVGEGIGTAIAADGPVVLAGASLTGFNAGAALVFRLDGPDCDGDGLNDDCSVDCNGNGVPDSCDIDPADPDGDGVVIPDCNDNGVPDDCDPDCNENGVPDDCDLDPNDPDGDGVVLPDCNRNGVVDECEPDCDGDGVPNDCEPGDCNGNGVPDSCELPGAESMPTVITGPASGFGRQVIALDGDRMLVTASLFSTPDHATGFFLDRGDNGTWTIAQTIAYDLAQAGGGIPAVIDGDTAAVGLWKINEVIVYEYDGVWSEVAVLAAPVASWFGISLAIEDDLLVVSATAAVGGAVHIFRRDASTGTWTQEASFAGEGALGASVAIVDGVVLAGDPHADPNGVIRLFARPVESEAWNEIDQLRPPREGFQGGFPDFGNSFDTDGHRLIVSTPGDDTDYIDVYRNVGCHRWALETTIENDVHVFSPGPVGIDGDQIAAGVDHGAVAVLHRDPMDGSWPATRIIMADDFPFVPMTWDRGRLAIGTSDREVHLHHLATDCNGNGVPDECESADGPPAGCVPPTCIGDVTGNRVVECLDLAAVLVAWGCDDSPADVTGDGRVDVNDITGVIAAWGSCD